MATDETLSRDSHGLPRPWPFDQPPTGAAHSSRQVVHYAKPILEVYHDSSNHSWQFHTAGELSREDVLCVSMKTIVLQDFTVTEVADLAPGWMASREAAGQPWRRSQYQNS